MKRYRSDNQCHDSIQDIGCQHDSTRNSGPGSLSPGLPEICLFVVCVKPSIERAPSVFVFPICPSPVGVGVV